MKRTGLSVYACLCSLAFMLLLSSTLSAGFVYRNSGQPASGDFLKEIYSQVHDLRNTYLKKGIKINHMDILDMNGETYILPAGTFDVYQWNQGGWVNLYTGPFTGYNFHSYKFLMDGHIHSYGGYGYWQHHGQIITFLWDRGEWEMLPFSRDLERNSVYFDGESLVSFWGDPIKINLRQKKVESLPPFKYAAEPIIDTPICLLEFEKYVYFKTNGGFYIYDKDSGDLWKTKIKSIGDICRSSPEDYLYQIISDSLTIYNNAAEIILATNLDLELNKFDKVSGNGSSSLALAVGLGLLAVVIVGIGLYYTRFSWNKKGLDRTLDDPLFEVLSACRGNVMDMEDFDVILGIDKIIPAETQRFRRAQLIKSLNRKYRAKHGHNIIERQRDPEDGRRYVYRVV